MPPPAAAAALEPTPEPRRPQDRTFVLSHYAGEVVYTIEGWVEKNKDELSPDVLMLLEVHSQFERLSELARADTQKKLEAAESKAKPGKRGGGGMKKKTVAKTFSEQLATLMEKLRATEHHYIRCLKPNQTLQAGDWDNDFMFKQLAYSGTLEVTQIRKAGLNVRRPLKHFYQYYKICADDPSALRAGTVTKRTELLLKQLGVDENKYRVGKTLLFLLNFEIMEQLDAIRTERVAEYVIILQSYMRMLKPLLHYKRAKRCILRLQGFCKSWEIRRAYCEVRAAAKLLERWTRTYLAHQKLLDMRESDDPALTPDKKREALLKILYPAKHGRGRIGLSGKRRPLRIQPTRTVGDDADEDEFVEMPRFEVAYEGWLVCKVGQMGKYEKRCGTARAPQARPPQLLTSPFGPLGRYVSLKQGTLSLYVDHEALQVSRPTARPARPSARPLLTAPPGRWCTRSTWPRAPSASSRQRSRCGAPTAPASFCRKGGGLRPRAGAAATSSCFSGIRSPPRRARRGRRSCRLRRARRAPSTGTRCR